MCPYGKVEIHVWLQLGMAEFIFYTIVDWPMFEVICMPFSTTQLGFCREEMYFSCCLINTSVVHRRYTESSIMTEASEDRLKHSLHDISTSYYNHTLYSTYNNLRLLRNTIL